VIASALLFFFIFAVSGSATLSDILGAICTALFAADPIGLPLGQTARRLGEE